jgi:hypothetical protein
MPVRTSLIEVTSIDTHLDRFASGTDGSVEQGDGDVQFVNS